MTDTEVSRTKPEFVVSPECEDILRGNKLETKIDWMSGLDRYKYILSTPDISVKDSGWAIDAIKIAKKGVELYNIESYSAGQLLQARHGILCIDELPVSIHASRCLYSVFFKRANLLQGHIRSCSSQMSK